MGTFAVTAYVRFELEDMSNVGCGLVLPRIADSQKWGLKSAIYEPL